LLQFVSAMRTHRRPSAMGEIQGMATTGASGSSFSVDRYRTALDPESLSVDDDIGDLPACRFDNPAERLPRYVHPGCCPFLIQAFEIGKTQRLVLVDVQEYLFPTRQRRSPVGPETGSFRDPVDIPAAFWSGHNTLRGPDNKHMLIIKSREKIQRRLSL